MRTSHWLCLAALLPIQALAQHTLDVLVKDSLTDEPIPGACVAMDTCVYSDAEGRTHLTGIPAGGLNVLVSAGGYTPHGHYLMFPYNGPALIVHLCPSP